jgi:hypothetical protein
MSVSHLLHKPRRPLHVCLTACYPRKPLACPSHSLLPTPGSHLKGVSQPVAHPRSPLHVSPHSLLPTPGVTPMSVSQPLAHLRSTSHVSLTAYCPPHESLACQSHSLHGRGCHDRLTCAVGVAGDEGFLRARILPGSERAEVDRLASDSSPVDSPADCCCSRCCCFCCCCSCCSCCSCCCSATTGVVVLAV